MSIGNRRGTMGLDAFFEGLDLDSPRELGGDTLESAYLRSAAVLSSFDPRDLAPVLPNTPSKPAKSAAAYLEPSTMVGGAPTLAWPTPQRDPWRLRFSEAVQQVGDDPYRLTLTPAARRTVLGQMGGREALQAALAANRERPDDPIQQAFERLVAGEEVLTPDSTREELSAVSHAVGWLDGLIDQLPDPAEVKQRLEQAEILRVFQRLVEGHFAGRREELSRLRDHIGLLPSESLASQARRVFREVGYSVFQRPPLVVHGPGGIGKSTLMAKLLLEHLEADETARFPFAYLNLDRSSLDAGQPLTLLIDAAWQLGVQFPAHRSAFQDVSLTAGHAFARQDELEAEKSIVNWSFLLQDLGRVLDAAVPGDAPFVVVVDTFEEAQVFGDSVVKGVWRFLQRLQEIVPRTRSIVAGRAPVRETWITEEVELREFDPESARAALRDMFAELGFAEVPEGVLSDVVGTVGGNPLSLRLAARVVQQEGPKALQSVKSRQKLFRRLKAEQIQAILHGRILKHLKDKSLAKIAYPGLLVRRITPGVIAEVLAGPCELTLAPPEDATSLFASLAKEVTLVEADHDDPDPPALRHRENVRRLMLSDLSRVREDVAEAIHRGAVAYYEGRDDPVSRAEEIYHRLWLGEPASVIEARWSPDMNLAHHLASALEELRPRQRAILASCLGVSLDPDSRKEAEREEWERSAARRAEQLLASGEAQAALDVIHEERGERLAGSPLWRLEVGALRALGDDKRARRVANQGLEETAKEGDTALSIALLLQLAQLEETQGRLGPALEAAEEADQLAAEAGREVDGLRAAVIRARLLRKRGTEKALIQRERVAEQLRREVSSHRHDLPAHPALYREIVAELGETDLDVLKDAVARLGLELVDDAQIDDLARSLESWNRWLGQTRADDGVGPLSRMVEVGPSVTDWRAWVEENLGSRLSRSIVRFLDAFLANEVIQGSLTRQFRAEVEHTLRPAETRARARKRPHRRTL